MVKVGSQASANLFSLVMTARANGLEPFKYLSKLFERLPTATTVEAVEALLPWDADTNVSVPLWPMAEAFAREARCAGHS
jgi:hypothetical protein